MKGHVLHSVFHPFQVNPLSKAPVSSVAAWLDLPPAAVVVGMALVLDFLVSEGGKFSQGTTKGKFSFLTPGYWQLASDLYRELSLNKHQAAQTHKWQRLPGVLLWPLFGS